MASGPLGAGGGVGEKHRWADSKVYTRKALKSTSKSNPNSQLQTPPPPLPQQEAPKQPLRALEDANSALQSTADLPASAPHENEASTRGDAIEPPGVSNHVYAGRENGVRKPVPPPPLLVSHRVENGELHRVIDFNSAARSGPEMRELRKKLAEELEQVRGLIRKLEAREKQLVPPMPVAVPPLTGYISQPQVSSGNDALPIPVPVMELKRFPVSSDPGSGFGTATPLQRQLNVSVPVPIPLGQSAPLAHVDNNSVSMSDNMEKEKRTPKANQFYRNSDFITGKDRFPPADSHKKSKANGGKKGNENVSAGIDKLYSQAYKSCSALLTRLMKHKHGWVFNTPVDVKGLGLYDYHQIIKHPMDLGTVKTRLNSNWYKSPREFAEDVRLTFRNAMTYNPKGQDVHVMAEQLLKIFEDKWPSIEAEFTLPSHLMMTKKMPPPPLDMRRILERTDSTAHQLLLDSTPRLLTYTPHSTRPPALKKPKAKDLNKRDMTFEEKQKLSNNLQSLPSEKLEMIVQIIKKRNSSLSQHDDEIEVDIDSVDTETLWELDRFVTNYKKSLSKHKRRAELAIQAKQEAERNAQKLQSQVTAVAEVPVPSKTDEKDAEVTRASPVADNAKGDNESASSSSCSSSSDSGSSSSDSDSDSSSS